MKAAIALGCLLLAACGAPGSLFGPDSTVPAFRDERMTVQDAAAAIAAGRSTRGEVTAALGPAQVVRFASGYEVWVYRRKPARASAAGDELVLLFSPSGILSKVRTRQ